MLFTNLILNKKKISKLMLKLNIRTSKQHYPRMLQSISRLSLTEKKRKRNTTLPL